MGSSANTRTSEGLWISSRVRAGSEDGKRVRGDVGGGGGGWPRYAADLMGFLQADQGDQGSRLRDSLSRTLAGFLRKVGSARPVRMRPEGKV